MFLKSKRMDAIPASNPGISPPVKLRLANVTKTFDSATQKVAALQAVNLEIREGEYVAEIDVELLEDEDAQPGWGPYFSADHALKLDDVRRALREGNIAEAAKTARIYRLIPVSAA